MPLPVIRRRGWRDTAVGPGADTRDEEAEQLSAQDQASAEGHIRCLVLTILLAKAEAIGAPLIILDDAINAIAALIQLDDRMSISGKDAYRPGTCLRCCCRRSYEAKRGELAISDVDGQRLPLAPDKVAMQEAS